MYVCVNTKSPPYKPSSCELSKQRACVRRSNHARSFTLVHVSAVHSHGHVFLPPAVPCPFPHRTVQTTASLLQTQDGGKQAGERQGRSRYS